MFIVSVTNSSGGHGDRTEIVGLHENLEAAVSMAEEPWNKWRTMASIDHGVFISVMPVNVRFKEALIYARRYEYYVDGKPQGTDGDFKEAEWYAPEYKEMLRASTG